MGNDKKDSLIFSKRVYEEVSVNDGVRVLVDRLWPRGVKKEEVKIDLWAKTWAPSKNLREWFHQNKEGRFTEFTEKYLAELKEQRVEIKENLIPFKNQKITLLTANKDIKLSHVPTLQNFVEKLLKTF